MDEKRHSYSRQMYDEFSFGVFSYGQSRLRYYPLLLELLRAAGPEIRLCEVGCGAGFWMDVYTRSGIAKSHITGVDLAPSNAQRLRERGFEGVCADVLDLTLTTSSYDVVTAIGVIHHAVDPQRAFAELVRISKPSGRIYLAVYNKWHPYHYVVHRAAAPARFLYWHWSKKVVTVLYPLWKLALQPICRYVLKVPLDDRSCRTLFMDHVMTPYAHLFSKADLRRYAASLGCEVISTRRTMHGLMREAIIKVGVK